MVLGHLIAYKYVEKQRWGRSLVFALLVWLGVMALNYLIETYFMNVLLVLLAPLAVIFAVSSWTSYKVKHKFKVWIYAIIIDIILFFVLVGLGVTLILAQTMSIAGLK